MVEISFFFPTTNRDFSLLPSIKLLEELGKTETKDVLLKVLDRIVPTPEEEITLKNKAESILNLIGDALESINVDARVELEGSLAKGTWLSGNTDFDIFLLFDPTKVPSDYKHYFLELLKSIANKLKVEYQVRFAEHPYIRIKLSGIEADLVPAFDVPPTKIISAVDRTPHHTRYVREYITPTLANEVRLLKAFLKGIGTYGAEIKIGGFPGYACELLIIYHRSFIRTLEFLSRKRRFFVDITKTWKLKDALKAFHYAEFILIDPTDHSRNVTSALRKESLYKTQLMSKLFLYSPKEDYFYGFTKKESYEDIDTAEILSQRNIFLVMLTKNEEIPPDVYWGQARKILNGIKKLINNSEDFTLLLIDIIESTRELIIVAEVDNIEIEKIKKLCGPPTYAKLENILKFIEQHTKESIAGPWVENDKICILRKIKADIIENINKYLATLKIAPSFRSYKIIHEKNEITKILETRKILNDFKRAILQKEIIQLLT